ncbi:protein kinase domain-containing protein [Streptomyces indicus]|uniref:Serine/threonine protein kinase n=1 Tax=Streptomyces indicus TaxID=417292 RepID=A0A1G9DI14_9ACTN|nr:protein kinase [Streptomyces indicus]SDK63533.1 Serine/threonine protein kinase [Streptomyces indicus]
MELRDADPREIGGYVVEERLGSGGMGVVYRARTASGRPLAVKVVHAHYADDEEFRVRFRRELAAARRVSGAFTAPVVDADPEADRPWMATLYIPGENLGGHVRKHGPLPVDRLRELATGLAEALRELHRADVVHRDLKPANVMLAEDGPRVIDFGISRAATFHDGQPLTDTGRVMGTPPYMSPEQLADPREVGPPADVFLLGSVLVYAATGRGPFDGDSPYETAIRVVEGTPQLDGVPAELRPVVERCLDKSPKERPTPAELLALLRGELPLPEAAPGKSAAPRPEDPSDTPTTDLRRAAPATALPHRTPSRRLSPAAVLGVFAVALAVVAGFFLVRTLRSDDGNPPADQASELPAGYRPWQSRLAGGSGTPFAGCAADGGRALVCAGSDLAAAQFALADGRAGWQLPVDPTPDDFSGDEGSLIGVRGTTAFVYTNADEPKEKNGEVSSTVHFRILALDTATGRPRWQQQAGHGDDFIVTPPSPDAGGAALLRDGLVAVTGRNGGSYTLLDLRTGEPRWSRPLPARQYCSLHAAAGAAYLMCSDEESERYRIGLIDQGTGRVTWTDLGSGYFAWLGEHRGRALLLGMSDDTAVDRLLAVDPGRLPRAGTSSADDPAVAPVTLNPPQSSEAVAQLTPHGLYFSHPNGRIDAVSPDTGRRLWRGDARLDQPGPATTSATHVYVVSPGGRVSALNRTDGTFAWSRGAPADAGTPGSDTGPTAHLHGDALYIPYGTRAVFSIDVDAPEAPLHKAPKPSKPPPPAPTN